MEKEDKYKQNAEFAEDMARRANSPDDKASWLRIAGGWLSLVPSKRPIAPEHLSASGATTADLKTASEPHRD